VVWSSGAKRTAILGRIRPPWRENGAEGLAEASPRGGLPKWALRPGGEVEKYQVDQHSGAASPFLR
jgi:hypothetical protein